MLFAVDLVSNLTFTDKAMKEYLWNCHREKCLLDNVIV